MTRAAFEAAVLGLLESQQLACTPEVKTLMSAILSFIIFNDPVGGRPQCR